MSGSLKTADQALQMWRGGTHGRLRAFLVSLCCFAAGATAPVVDRPSGLKPASAAEAAVIAHCEPGAIPEGEPDCGPVSDGGDGIDEVNGGCAWPPCEGCPLGLFQPITCGDTYCGTYAADAGIRDSDWYFFELTDRTEVTGTLEVSYPGRLDLWATDATCESIGHIASVRATPDAVGRSASQQSLLHEEGPGVLTRCLDPGTYAFRVTTDFEFEGVPCGQDYTLHMTCAPSCLGACTDPGNCTCTADVAEDDCIAPLQWADMECCEVECGTAPGGYASLNVQLLSRTPVEDFPDEQYLASALTSYASPSGQEYAIITFTKGTGFVRVTDPTLPEIVGYIDGEGIEGIHREVAAFGGYAYIVTEDNNFGVGLQVVDLTQIDSNIVTRVNTTQLGVGFETAHTVFINPDSGYLYLNRANFTSLQGLVALDLNADPVEPPIAGIWTDSEPAVNCHDSTVVSYTSGPYAGREIAFCFAENDGLKIVDVTDKSDMFTLSSVLYPGTTYCHQGWPTENRRFLFINDEGDELNDVVPQTTSYVINIEDLYNPYFFGTFSNGSCATDHNHMVRGHYLYEANYSTGLRVFDVRDITNIVEVGYFDTHPEHNAVGFDGMWGVNARLPSGVVVCSDRQRGLFVFGVPPQDCGRLCDAGSRVGLPCLMDADCPGGECGPCTRVHVDAQATGANNGTSWPDAYRHLQWAIADADNSGGTIKEIWVAAGTYTPAQSECRTDSDCDLNAGLCLAGTCAQPAARERTFRQVNGFVLYGGFDGSETISWSRDPFSNPTILSGDLNGNDDPTEFPNGASYSDNSYHVITIGDASIPTFLEYFTITGGRANGATPHDRGGGMYFDGAQYLITQYVTFEYNSAVTGGAVYLNNAPNVPLLACTFRRNAASDDGGAIATENSNYVAQNSVFEDNSAGGRGGAISDASTGTQPTIQYNTFLNNVAGTLGGAIDTGSGVRPTIKGCTFTGNRAEHGGGIVLFASNPPTVVSRCVFERNLAIGGTGIGGGGALLPNGGGGGFAHFVNCRFTDNVSVSQGGGLSGTDQFSDLRLINCLFDGNQANNGSGGGVVGTMHTFVSGSTFSGNTSSDAGAGIFVVANPAAYLQIGSSVLWNNLDAISGTGESDQFIGAEPYTTLNYSLVQGLTGTYFGTGNIDADPLFQDALGGDFRLLSGSPAIDAGDTGWLLYDFADLDEDYLTSELHPRDLGNGLRVYDDAATADSGIDGPCGDLVCIGGPAAGSPCSEPIECMAGPCGSTGPSCGVVDMGPYEYVHDCNFNGQADECDLDCAALNGVCAGRPFCGQSADLDADEMPDECFSGAGGGSFDSAVPDDAHVVLEAPGGQRFAGGGIWTLGAGKRVASMVTEQGTLLQVNGGDLSFKESHMPEADPAPVFVYGTVQVDGAFTVGEPDEATGSIAATPLIVGPGGAYQKHPDAQMTPVSAELYAGQVVLKAGMGTLDGGKVELSDQMAFFVAGDLNVEGAPLSTGQANAAAAGISFPPKLRLAATSAATGARAASSAMLTTPTLSVAGSLRLRDEVEFFSDGDIFVSGDFDDRSIRPALIDLTESLVQIEGAGLSIYEVAGLDLGPNEEGFATDQDTLYETAAHRNYALGTLVVKAPPAASAARASLYIEPDVIFTNEFANSAPLGACAEALYVDTLVLEQGTKVVLDDVRVYYRALVDQSATITPIGCGELVQVVAAAPPLEDPAVVFPADTATVNKNRFISVVIPAAAAGQEAAIRVELVSMAAAPAGPGTPSGRQFRYVTGFGGSGTDFDCVGSINFGQNYNCGQLVCSDSGLPIYRDWGDMAGEVLHITGDAVHAGSQYAASLIPQSCGDTASADTCGGSTPLALNTAVWGDHADAGGNPLLLDGTANVIDISFAVDKVKDLATALPEPRIWKKDADPDPNGANINVLDAAFTVDAVKNLPYPASFVITVCP